MASMLRRPGVRGLHEVTSPGRRSLAPAQTPHEGVTTQDHEGGPACGS